MAFSRTSYNPTVSSVSAYGIEPRPQYGSKMTYTIDNAAPPPPGTLVLQEVSREKSPAVTVPRYFGKSPAEQYQRCQKCGRTVNISDRDQHISQCAKPYDPGSGRVH